MNAFFGFLGETIRSIFQGKFLPQDISTIYAAYSSDFGVPGTILFVVLIVLLVALALSLFIFFFIGAKRLFRRRPKGYDEKKMMEEIERLNLELYDVTREKDRILSLSREADGIYAPTVSAGGGGGGAGTSSAAEAINGGRFAKLYVVDEKYKDGDFVTNLPEDSQNISLKEICERFRNFACSQMKLYYSPEVVRQFFAAMGTGHLIILEGISGTGKTSLPYCMGRFLRHQTAICSVQPSWRDRSELLGYYNDFTKKFTETEFLRAVYKQHLETMSQSSSSMK